MTQAHIKTVNVRLPKDIIHLLDLLVEKGLYSSRSEAVRDFARDFVNNQTPQGNSPAQSLK